LGTDFISSNFFQSKPISIAVLLIFVSLIFLFKNLIRILANIKETVELCQKNNIKIFATSPRAKINYLDGDYTQGSAILMGSEDKGLSDEWLKSANIKLKIEMKGMIDSLNLSVSTALLVFEVLRQRKQILSPIDQDVKM
jgi:TrmH family RNA methyltransferase